MNTRWMSAGALGLAVVSLLAVNVASRAALRSARLDLTDNGLYTLSQGTKNILAGLTEPITLRLFVSQKLATRLPGISGYVSRVRELLAEYQRRSGGHLQVVVVEPEPFSEEEDQAVGYGLQGIPIGDGESTFYFGLAASGPTEEEAVIPFLSMDRAEFLEYDLTKVIHEVNHPHPKVVGLVTGLPMDGRAPQARFAGHPATRPWVVLDQMRQLFTVRTLGAQIDAAPKDIDILMLVQPKGLSDATLYAID
jgi:ABC-type uncharacterized transport system involved in gliding motility auxiliary subunit